MSSVSVFAQFLVHSLYRPLVFLLLVMLTTACVPAPDAAPTPPSRRPVAVPSKPPVFKPQVAKPAPLPRAPFGTDTRAPQALVQTIKSLGENFKGRVGIAVTRVDSNWIAEHQGPLLFPQHSVSKLWVGMALCDAVDRGELRFSDTMRLTKADLTLFHQPIKQLIGDDGYETTLSDLFYRAMTESDNTANDSLLRRVGGPETIRRMIERKGLGTIRFGPGERLFQSAVAGLEWRQEYSIGNAFELARAKLSPETRGQAMIRYLNDPMDGAAPNAVVLALAKLKRGELLSPQMTQTLLSAMESAKTGKQRVKAGVAPGWTYGHKTGTGQVLEGLVTGYNDVGILTAPDGTSYALAILIRSTREGIRERQALMQAVAQAIIANHER